MELVIDTSAILAVVVNEPEKAALIRATAGVELVAPASVSWEVGNAFSAMFKRKKITLEQAKQALAVYRSIPIRYLEVDLEAAVTIANKLSIYAYDAYMIVCAQAQGCDLLTLDGGLIHAAKQVGISTVELSE